MFELSKHQEGRKAFTLFEIIIVLSIFIILMIVIWSWQKDIFSINAIFNNRLISQDNLLKALKNFIAETRTAQSSEANAYAIEKAEEDEFIFFSDYDYDGTVERLRYFVDNGTFKKGVIEPSGQPPTYNPNNEVVINLIRGVINENNEVFFYYDKNYDGDNDPLEQPVDVSEVRLVKIIITVNENPNRPLNAITETSQTSIRNLKDNL